MKKRTKGNICPECGCTIEVFGRKMERLCPWCDEARLIVISSEAVRKNNKKINYKLVNK